MQQEKRWAIVAVIVVAAAILAGSVVGYGFSMVVNGPVSEPVARGGSYSTFTAYGTYTETITTTAKNVISFTGILTDLATANVAIVGARAAGIMYTLDGSRPLSDTGIPLVVNGSATIMGVSVQQMVFVQEGTAPAIVTVVLEK